MSKDKVVLSQLGHTWVLDLDGTLVKHNGYLLDGYDTMLEGATDFLANIPEEDLVIIVTSRKTEYREQTLQFLKDNNVKYDHIIFEAPYGERIVVNDRKPSGLQTAISINIDRDNSLPEIVIDANI